jgi:hypothetical protein
MSIGFFVGDKIFLPAIRNKGGCKCGDKYTSSIKGRARSAMAMNNVPWRLLTAACICLALVIVSLPQTGNIIAGSQLATPLSISNPDNTGSVAIASPGETNAIKYAVKNKRVATNGAVASPNLFSVFSNNRRFLNKIVSFPKYAKAFRRVCLVLDLPPPYITL